MITLISVDLPAPFSPTRAWTSPARRSNETPFKACTPANALLIPVSSRSPSETVGHDCRSSLVVN